MNASFRAQLEVIKSSFEKYLGYLIDDSILDLPEPIEQTEPIQKTKKISRTKKEKSNKKDINKNYCKLSITFFQ